jgi:hypothetical protein
MSESITRSPMPNTGNDGIVAGGITNRSGQPSSSTRRRPRSTPYTAEPVAEPHPPRRHVPVSELPGVGVGLPIHVLLSLSPDSWQVPGPMKHADGSPLAPYNMAMAGAVSAKVSQCEYHPPCGDCARQAAEQMGELRSGGLGGRGSA